MSESDLNRISPFLDGFAGLTKPLLHRTTQTTQPSRMTQDDTGRLTAIAGAMSSPQHAAEREGPSDDDASDSDDPDASWLSAPFPDFLRRLCEWTAECEFGRDDAGMFMFTRAIKSYGCLACLTPFEAYEYVCAELETLAIAPKNLGSDLLSEDGHTDFLSKWEKIRFTFGADPLAIACAVVNRDGVRLESTTRRTEGYRAFVMVAALLQMQRPRMPILLPVHLVAKHLDCQAVTISAWLRWAKADGLLLKTAEHVFRSGSAGRAAEYVFALHRWDLGVIQQQAERVGVLLNGRHLAWTAQQFEADVSGDAS